MRMRFAIGGLVTALLAGFVSGAQAQSSGETIKIQDYPGLGNMLFRVAVAKGYCEKHGIRCQLQMIPTGPLGAQALLAKSIDMGLTPAEVQINAMIKGAQLKAIGGGAVQNVFLVAVRADLASPNAGKGVPASGGSALRSGRRG